tara:strand:- start:1391 stop:1663 length:273 start_codon:yes stop_codon:yes gene_type:complete
MDNSFDNRTNSHLYKEDHQDRQERFAEERLKKQREENTKKYRITLDKEEYNNFLKHHTGYSLKSITFLDKDEENISLSNLSIKYTDINKN